MSGLPDFYRLVVTPTVEETLPFGTGRTDDFDITEVEYTEVYRLLLTPSLTPKKLRRVTLHIEWQMKTLDAAYSVSGKWQIGDGETPTVWTDIGTERSTLSTTYEDFIEDDFYQPSAGTQRVTVRLVCRRTAPGPGGKARVNLGRSYADMRTTMI